MIGSSKAQTQQPLSRSAVKKNQPLYTGIQTEDKGAKEFRRQMENLRYFYLRGRCSRKARRNRRDNSAAERFWRLKYGEV